MNRLSVDQQSQIIKILCEGSSLRSTARITGASINSVVKLLKDVGSACLAYQDTNIRNLKSQKLQVNKIWFFVYAKAKNVPEEHANEFGYGDVWTLTAMDAETKLIAGWKVGQRNIVCATEFTEDL
jgi:hypothetical protein